MRWHRSVRHSGYTDAFTLFGVRAMRYRVRSALTALVLVNTVSSAVAQTSQGVAPAQGQATLERWQGHLENQARDGTIWWTSNAAYVDDDAIDAYLIRYEMLPGTLAARGCLWGERDGQVMGPFWEFFMAWDVEQRRPMLYQVSPADISGIGYLTWSNDGTEIAEQTFRQPDGSITRVMHETTVPDHDTRVSRSFDWIDEQWTPRRSYTWTRRRGAPPC